MTLPLHDDLGGVLYALQQAADAQGVPLSADDFTGGGIELAVRVAEEFDLALPEEAAGYLGRFAPPAGLPISVTLDGPFDLLSVDELGLEAGEAWGIAAPWLVLGADRSGPFVIDLSEDEEEGSPVYRVEDSEVEAVSESIAQFLTLLAARATRQAATEPEGAEAAATAYEVQVLTLAPKFRAFWLDGLA